MTTKSVDPSNPPAAVVELPPAEGLDKSFEWLKFWWAFWFAVVVIVFVAFRYPKQWGILHPPKFLIAMAVFSTAIFALYAVLLPFLRQEAGLKPTWVRAAFFSVVILYTIASFGLGTYYLDLALHDLKIQKVSAPWINFSSITFSIKEYYPAFITWIIRWLYYAHTFLFVLLILIMDLLAWGGASYANKKDESNRQDEFKKICLFIDVPMVLGVGYANLLVYSLARETEREFFLSGAVALQLLVANMQLLLFPYFNYFRDDAHDSKMEKLDLKSDSSDAAQPAAPEGPRPDRASGDNVADTSADGHTGQRTNARPSKSGPAQDNPDSDGQAPTPRDTNIASPPADPDLEGKARPH
jgi:hypothetical protein